MFEEVGFFFLILDKDMCGEEIFFCYYKVDFWGVR